MNTYLISINSYHLQNNEIKKIVKDNNYTIFNMNKTSIKELIDEASYVSFVDEKKYILASNADFFSSAKTSDEDNDLLVRYLTNPNPNTIIIFTTFGSLDSRKKIVKAIKDKGTIINPPKLDKKGINTLLNKYLLQNDFKADYNSINYIINNSYDNIDIMINELDKIMLYYNFPCTIKYNDVIKIVGEELDSNNFHFINAVIEKNLAGSLKILKSLKVYKVEPTSLVILLAREYRLIYYVKNLYKEMSLNEIMDYLSLQDWQIKKLYENANKYSNKELLDNLVYLCNIDLNIKTGIWDKDIALYGFLLEACS